jgi:hypothetical protein
MDGQVGAVRGVLIRHANFNVNSSFISGINSGKFGQGKQINAETRIKSINATEAVAAADTVYQTVAGTDR